MIYLICRSVIDKEALKKSKTGDEFNELVHCYWTLVMPFSDVLEEALLSTGFPKVTINDGSLFVTANTQEWHLIVRHLNRTNQKPLRQFVSLVVNSFPDIFKTMSRTMDGEGLLRLT